MWDVLSCFLSPLLCLLMIDSSQKAMANPESADLQEPEGHCKNGCCAGIWTFQENQRFESALATLSGPMDISLLCDFVKKITPEFPGKSAEQLGRHLEALWHDVDLIESGEVTFPGQWPADEEGGRGRERKRGMAWTKEEHERFLSGLEIYGRGDWKSIARHVVVSKSPTQVASHAQKYFNRKDRAEEEKLRRSINDTHSINDTPGIGHIGAMASMSSSLPSARYADSSERLDS
ncbi:transcription factor SRM1-like [Rhodamnia argentea]|uniref:Transcription factor SRM1-like n=1 Tax=Rhodamnia argentea TaxID=178133 RepID=A0A8B8NNF2_9MYRT|nr:transcription factor SRM1-like [Rhodamnia argentea]